MGNFAEVLTNNQAKNKARDEIGKKLETFDNCLIAYNKAKSSTEVAIISINPNKKKKLQRWLQLALTPETPLGPMPV